jgi:dipicolinate synthase subunit A
MLENFNILIIGGDARTLEVIRRLGEKNANIYIAGFERADIHHPNIHQINLGKVDPGKLDAILLPVAGLSETGLAKTDFATEQLYVTNEIFAGTPAHCVICTGIAGDFLERAARTANRRLLKIFARNDVAVYNSIPTAEGVLMLAIQHTDVTVHGANVFIFGFGRVGITVARTFHAIGANVTVAARNDADLAHIQEKGLNPIHFNELHEEIANAAICINTVPRLVLDAHIISAMHKSALIIDIASAPGGTDFQFAEKHGITALHSLGLPGKTAPKTAGSIIADAFIKMISS